MASADDAVDRATADEDGALPRQHEHSPAGEMMRVNLGALFCGEGSRYAVLRPLDERGCAALVL